VFLSVEIIIFIIIVIIIIILIVIIIRQKPAVQQVTLTGSHQIPAIPPRLLLGWLPLVSLTQFVFNDTGTLLTYLLSPWSRVLLEKLTSLQLFKKYPTFYGNRWFITPFTSARHLYLSWASSIQSIPPHPTSWRSILILSSHLRLGLPSGLFPYSITYCNSTFNFPSTVN
jgi:hypothetical protein